MRNYATYHLCIAKSQHELIIQGVLVLSKQTNLHQHCRQNWHDIYANNKNQCYSIAQFEMSIEGVMYKKNCT